MNKLQIQNHSITRESPTFIIAEVAQAHDGKIEIAHKFIDLVAKSGADAIKFQTHIAEAESTLDEPFRIQMDTRDRTRYEYWKRMEFSPAEWEQLAAHAQDCGLVFLSSAFSEEAVDLLDKIGMPAWKIGSGEFASKQLLQKMMETQKPILFSTGMANWKEIDIVVDILKKHQPGFVLFQCTSSYPTALEDVGLNVIDKMRKKYACFVGLSDHSGSVYPGLAAISRSDDILEVHVKFDRNTMGPDATSSITMEELELLVKAKGAFKTLWESFVDKDDKSIRLEAMRSLFSKSIAPIDDLKKGTVLEKAMLTEKKPGTGISWDQIDTLVGRKLKRNVSLDRLLRKEDVE